MVQRYEVSPGQLASPVVGTPGVDPSAGKAAEAVGKMADENRNQFNQAAMQRSQNSQQMFNNAAAHFQNFSAQQAHQAMFNRAVQNEQRKQKVQLDLDDERSRVTDYTDGLKDKFASNPQGAIAQFKNDLPQLQQQFEQRYAQDPIQGRIMKASMRGPVSGAMNDIKTWAQGETTKILNSRLEQIPQQVSDSISNLSGSMGDQIQGANKILLGKAQIYASIKASTTSEAAKNEIDTKFGALLQNSGKQLINHLVDNAPEDETGLSYLDALHGIVQKSGQFGIHLNPNDQPNLLSAIKSAYKGQVDKVVTGIKGNGGLATYEAKDIRNKLYLVANDPTKMTAVVQDVQNRLQKLDQQTALVAKEPDGEIKIAKLTAIKSQQSALIGETGQQLNQQRTFDSIERTIRLDGQRQFLLMQSQGDRQMRLADRQDAIARREETDRAKALNLEAENVKIQRTGIWNADWSTAQKDINAAMAEPVVKERQGKISMVVDKVYGQLANALHSGAIDANAYDSHAAELKKAMTTAAGSKNIPPNWFGQGGGEVPLKAKDKAKAELQASQMWGAIVKKNAVNFNYSEMARQQLNSLTMSKPENVILTSKFQAALPAILSSKAFLAKTPAQQQADIANRATNLVIHYRQGFIQH